MKWVDPLALIFGLRELVTAVYGPIVTYVFSDVQVDAYRHFAELGGAEGVEGTCEGRSII